MVEPTWIIGGNSVYISIARSRTPHHHGSAARGDHVPEATTVTTPEQPQKPDESAFYEEIQADFGEYAATILTSSIFLFVLLCGVVGLAWHVGGTEAGHPPVARNILLIILGILCGWVAGLFASPFSSEEKGEFAELKKAIYAFVTGYLLSKLDRFLERTLFESKDHVAMAWEQAALFGAAFLTVALWTFIWRKYGFRKKAPAPDKSSESRLGTPTTSDVNAPDTSVPVP